MVLFNSNHYCMGRVAVRYIIKAIWFYRDLLWPAAPRSILVSFALLGAAFFTLSYQYTIRQTRDSMERNADYLANFTSKARVLGVGVEDEVYLTMMATIAQISDAVVLITEADGEMVVSTDGITIQSYTQLSGHYLPSSVVDQVRQMGRYTGMSTLGGFFAEKRYVAGTPIFMSTRDMNTGKVNQTMIGVAYVAAEVSSLTELWRAFITIFFFTAVVVLCIAFLTSSVTSLKQTKPLQEIDPTLSHIRKAQPLLFLSCCQAECATGIDYLY